jgi:hypothetical protein
LIWPLPCIWLTIIMATSNTPMPDVNPSLVPMRKLVSQRMAAGSLKSRPYGVAPRRRDRATVVRGHDPNQICRYRLKNQIVTKL